MDFFYCAEDMRKNLLLSIQFVHDFFDNLKKIILPHARPGNLVAVKGKIVNSLF
jgi:hypothetical protein